MFNPSSFTSVRKAFSGLIVKVMLASQGIAVVVNKLQTPGCIRNDLLAISNLPFAAPIASAQDTNFVLALASSDAVTRLPKLRPGRPEQLEYG